MPVFEEYREWFKWDVTMPTVEVGGYTYANGRTTSQYYLASDYREMMIAMRAICANGGQVFIYTIQ